MTEKYFFVDYESVHQAGLKGIEHLTENDKVIIFYTPANETLTFGMYKKMIRSEADIELYRVQNGGKDAISFQICTFIGYVIGNSSESKYYIISNDISYEYMITFWKDRNTEVNMSPNILKIINQKIIAPAPEVYISPETDSDKTVKPFNISESDNKKLRNIYLYELLVTLNIIQQNISGIAT